MPFFSFTKSSRTQAVEKKLITIGPFVERCTPADLENRITLIPLAKAQKSKAIKFRTVLPYADIEEQWEEDPECREPSTLRRQPHVQKRAVSGSSTATTDTVDTWDADCSLMPEVFDYYVCHKRMPPVEPTIVDDNEDSGDISVSFYGDNSESCWLEGDSDDMDDMVTIDLDDTEDVKVEEVPAVAPAPPQRRIVRLEDTLLPLEAAFLRSDVRFRPEEYETKY